MANRRYIDFPIASSVGDSDIILIWQSGANKQTTKATFLSGLPTDLEDLNDVAISGLTNGQILRYDSVTGKWENTDQGNLDLNDLNDVSIVSPSNGQVLVYNSSTNKWENSSAGFVPYTGAVTTVNLGAQTIQAGQFVKAGGTSSQFLKADGSVDSRTFGTGTVTSVALTMPTAFSVANSPITTAGTLAVTATGNTTQYIAGDGSLIAFPVTGQAGTLVREVRNTTGATLTKGTVVYINGANGNKPTVAKALATGDSTSAQTFGLLQADLPNNSNGFLVAFGDLDGLDTQAFTEGVQLYLSPTVAGTYTSVKQYAPAHMVYIGVVTRSHPNQGRIEVRIQNGFEMDELHNVAAQNPDNNDILQYKTSTSLWTKVAGTTSNIAEGTNLYYTEARVNANTNVAANTAARHNAVTLGTANGLSLSTQVLSLGLASAGVTGALSGTDWTTFNSKQNALTNPVTGTGTSGQVAYFTGTTAISSESNLFWDSTNDRLGIKTNTPTATLDVKGVFATTSSMQIDHGGPSIGNFIQSFGSIGYDRLSILGSDILFLGTGTSESMRITTNKNLHIGTFISDNGARLQVNGPATISSSVTAVNAVLGNISENTNSIQINGLNNTFTHIGTGFGATFINNNSFFNGSAYVFDDNTKPHSQITLSAGVVALSTGSANVDPTAKVYVLNNGNVGIGTLSPSQLLELNGTSNLRFAMGAGHPYIQTNAQDLNFGTRTADLMVIKLGGNVGISTTNPKSLLQVGSVDANSNGELVLGKRVGAANRKFKIGLDAGFNLSFGDFGNNISDTYSPFFSIGFSSGVITINNLGTGTVSATAGVLSTISDSRYKTNDGFINSAIDKVLNLKPRYFYWNEKSGLPKEVRQLGFYAQEVNEALGEEAANKPKNENSSWGISDRSILAMLTKAIQELKEEIDTLKK